MNVLSCAFLFLSAHYPSTTAAYRPKDGDETEPQLYPEVEAVEDLSEPLTRKGLFDILEKVLSERGWERERKIIRKIQ
jgi:hypothetical protein